jgi:hypothetical protein
MEMEAVVLYREEFARYRVIPERQGVYQAQLVKYYGNPASAPPEQIVLVRGVRKWIGSYPMPELLNDLGRVIETTLPQNERVLNRKGGEPTNPDAG